MRFKLDENLPAGLTRLFAVNGCDCDTAEDEGLGGAADEQLIIRE